jgi:hypothetical protein
MYVRTHTSMYECVCVHAHESGTYMQTHTFIRTCMYSYVHDTVRTRTRACTHGMHAHAHARLHAHVHARKRMHAYMQDTRIRIRRYTFGGISTYDARIYIRSEE